MQGVLDREEIPKFLVSWVEGKYFRSFGKEGHLNYLVWFEGIDEVHWDFGLDNPGLTTGMSIDKLLGKE
jgi:hypothetical protein